MRLILGFHPLTPRPPQIAVRHGLVNRVAFAMDSHKEGAVDMFFDSGLFIKLIMAVSNVVPHDRTEVFEMIPPGFLDRLFHREQTKVIGTLDDLGGWFREDNDEPPGQIHWVKDSVPVLVGAAEYWNRIGGPEPYHDTYTFSLFGPASLTEIIAQALSAAADGAGITFEKVAGKPHF